MIRQTKLATRLRRVEAPPAQRSFWEPPFSELREPILNSWKSGRENVSKFCGNFLGGLLAATDPSILSGYRQGIIKIPLCWIVTYWTIVPVTYCTYFTQKPKYWLVLKFWYIGMRCRWPKILKSSSDWTKQLGNFKGNLFVKLDFGVV